MSYDDDDDYKITTGVWCSSQALVAFAFDDLRMVWERVSGQDIGGADESSVGADQRQWLFGAIMSAFFLRGVDGELSDR